MRDGIDGVDHRFPERHGGTFPTDATGTVLFQPPDIPPNLFLFHFILLRARSNLTFLPRENENDSGPLTGDSTNTLSVIYNESFSFSFSLSFSTCVDFHPFSCDGADRGYTKTGQHGIMRDGKGSVQPAKEGTDIMAINLYNTLTRQKEPLVTREMGKVAMYVCGPTPYDYPHIGNARTFVAFDTIRRYLEYSGYTVTFVQNFTDIDDKIIKRANEQGISTVELAEKFMAVYFEEMDRLNVKHATVHPRATENIPEIISIVEALIERGYAYVQNGDVYFEVRKFDALRRALQPQHRRDGVRRARRDQRGETRSAGLRAVESRQAG